MLTDPEKIAQTIINDVSGTTNDVMAYVDSLIEDGEICGEVFKQNEFSILVR